jgi:hypothetical protein
MIRSGKPHQLRWPCHEDNALQSKSFAVARSLPAPPYTAHRTSRVAPIHGFAGRVIEVELAGSVDVP